MHMQICSKIANKADKAIAEGQLDIAYVLTNCSLSKSNLGLNASLIARPISLSEAELAIAKQLAIKLNLPISRAIGLAIEEWLKHGRIGQEADYQAKLHKQLGGVREVPIAEIGRADLITSTHIWECKIWPGFKSAIGQALCYCCEYPRHKPGIALIGVPPISQKLKIEQVCKKLNIDLLWLE